MRCSSQHAPCLLADLEPQRGAAPSSVSLVEPLPHLASALLGQGEGGGPFGGNRPATRLAPAAGESGVPRAWAPGPRERRLESHPFLAACYARPHFERVFAGVASEPAGMRAPLGGCLDGRSRVFAGRLRGRGGPAGARSCKTRDAQVRTREEGWRELLK